MFGPADVLGIDPGLSRCGYGAVRRDGSQVRALAYGVIRTPPSEPLATRLAALEAELETLVREVRPAAVAVERVLFQANVRTAMSVGQASGLALAVAARAGAVIAHYSPNEVKLAVTGYGAADKAQVQQMVTRLLGLAEPPRPPDAADALALALCHAWSAPAHGATASAGASASAGGFERAVAAALARDDETGAKRSSAGAAPRAGAGATGEGRAKRSSAGAAPRAGASATGEGRAKRSSASEGGPAR